MTEKRKEKDSQKKKKEVEEREAEIEIRMVWRRGYSEEKEGCWWSACDGLTEKRKEKDSPKKKKNGRWRRKRGGDRDKDDVKKKKGLFREKRKVRWG